MRQLAKPTVSREFTGTTWTWRSACIPIALLAFAISGCATPALEGDSIEVVSRNNDLVSHGDIYSAFPRKRTVVIDIDRRTYMGHIEPTAPNDTFGFYRLYGPSRYAASPPAMPASDIHYKAVLSSADNMTLRCDLTQNDGRPRDGLCLDDFGRVYDVISSR
jgi:hypothetical protein